MGKFTFHKKKIVMADVNGEDSYSELATQYGMGKRRVSKMLHKNSKTA